MRLKYDTVIARGTSALDERCKGTNVHDRLVVAIMIAGRMLHNSLATGSLAHIAFSVRAAALSVALTLR